MPSARLRVKIIKDAKIGPTDGADPATVHLRVLDMAMLPFTLYVRLQLPAAHDPQPPLFLHLLARPVPPGRPAGVFATARLPGLPASDTSQGVRRILLVLTGEDIPDGRYRLALVRERQHIAVVDLAKRVDQLRVISKGPPPPSTEISPVLISGTHKSGTTWLEKVIDAHPDFVVLHEANTFNIFEQGALRRLVAERQEHFRYKDYIRWLNPAFDVNDFSRFLQISLAKELMLRLGRAWGARYVADRTPGYAGLYMHLSRFWEELRIVHIVRHPLDVLASRLFHEANLDRNAARAADISGPMLRTLNARLDSGETLLAGDFVSDTDAAGDTLSRLLRDWRHDQDCYLAASRTAPGPFHLVRYEDLVERFEAEASRIFAFIGTEPTRTDLAFIQRRTSFETLSGGRPAGEADARSFFRKGVAGDWRNVFSASQAAVLWTSVAGTASSFGYAMD